MRRSSFRTRAWLTPLCFGALACSPRDAGRAGGPATPPSAPSAPAAKVAVLSSEPCPLPESVESFYASMKEHAKGHHGHAGPPGAANAPPPPPVEQAYPAADFERLRLAASEGRCLKMRYRSEGLSVVGFIIKPPAAPKPSPAIVVARGGNRDLGKIETAMLLELTKLSDQGFVILATQYRGADGGEGADQFGGADLADLENLFPLARSMPEVDPQNLFLLGYSRGGMMAAMALRDRAPVRAAALFSGVYDLEADLERRPEMEQNYRELIPGFATNREAEMRRRGAVWWADEIKTPVLLLAGTRDRRVSFGPNSERLARMLGERGLEHKLVTYEDDHALASHRGETKDEIVGWFRAHMR